MGGKLNDDALHVVMQQFRVLMTFNDALPEKMLDTVTTRPREFSQTLNQIILRGWPARLSIKAKISFPKSCLLREVLPHMYVQRDNGRMLNLISICLHGLLP